MVADIVANLVADMEVDKVTEMVDIIVADMGHSKW